MEDIKIYEEIIRLKKARIPAALATIVESRGSAPRKAGAKMVVREGGATLGTIGGGKTEADTIVAAKEAIRTGRPRTLPFTLTEEHGSVCGGNILVYIEPLAVQPHLVVVGDGHVGRAVIRSAGQAGFAVTLINPEELCSGTGDTPSETLADGLSDVFATLGVDSGTCLFIATRDHNKDFLAAAAALQTGACYIGLLGSTRKRVALEKTLKQQGFKEEAISRIISPAGLAIGAQTPDEIAVSIVAQLIQQRRAAHDAACCDDSAGRRPLAANGAQQAITAAG